jgi:hypothetical protein
MMMEELYGPLGAGMIAVLVTVIAEWVKAKLGQESWGAIAIVAGLAIFFGGGFHLINMLMKWQSVAYAPTWIDYTFVIFGAIVYSAFSWLSAMGIYAVYRESKVK